MPKQINENHIGFNVLKTQYDDPAAWEAMAHVLEHYLINNKV